MYSLHVKPLSAITTSPRSNILTRLEFSTIYLWDILPPATRDMYEIVPCGVILDGVVMLIITPCLSSSHEIRWALNKDFCTTNDHTSNSLKTGVNLSSLAAHWSSSSVPVLPSCESSVAKSVYITLLCFFGSITHWNTGYPVRVSAFNKFNWSSLNKIEHTQLPGLDSIFPFWFCNPLCSSPGGQLFHLLAVVVMIYSDENIAYVYVLRM